MIHPKAIIDPRARLGTGVSVGPWCEIGADVEIGDDTAIAAHVVIKGPTRIGRGNRIFQFNSIGDDSQDKKYGGESTRLEIGDDNVIREFCTINRGTGLGGGVTRVGDNNWIMAYVHIAHDCQVGNGTVMANGTSLAGHVVVEDWVVFGGFTLVHQFCRIGAHSFTAAGSVLVKDLPPFVMVAGNTARPRSINTEGLRRRGFAPERIRALRRAYRLLYRKGLPLNSALAELVRLGEDWADISEIVRFVRESSRGIVR